MGRILRTAMWLLSVSTAFSAEPKWIHAASADFEIFSSAGEADTRRVLQHFERVRSFFEQALGPRVKQQAEPVRIVIFGSKKEFDLYRPNDFSTAFYTQIGGRDYIVLGGVGEDVFPTAVHEYVHLVAQHQGLHLPVWLNEGMADLYSTLKPLGDKIVVGNVIPGRMQQMASQKWVPLATILAATPDSPWYNEKDRANALYNEGWALAHMLELSSEYGPGFTAALQSIEKGTPSQLAIEQAYGKPLSAIEKDLQAYLRKDTLTGRLFTAKLQSGTPATVSPADPFDVKLTLLDLSNRPGKEAETLQKLNALAQEYPDRPEPQTALGYLDWRASRQDQATRDFTKAFDLGERNPQMLWDYGRLAGNSADAADAVRALNALLELQPGRVDARLVLAGMELNLHRPKEALATLKPLKTVTSAEAPRLYQMLAFAHLQNDDQTSARTAGLLWIESAKEPAEHERAMSFVKALDGRKESGPLQ
jgi:hypothetical protein